jgi:hypothetical protein
VAQGQNRGQNQGGDPNGNRPGGNAARDTKLRSGDPGAAHLREGDGSKKDAWGMINDREVARSVRELWGKIPPGYRSVVARYFKDITDLEPETKKE